MRNGENGIDELHGDGAGSQLVRPQGCRCADTEGIDTIMSLCEYFATPQINLPGVAVRIVRRPDAYCSI